MMENGFFCLVAFAEPKMETPLPSFHWARRWAEDTFPGGAKKKRPHEGGVGPAMLSPAGLSPQSIEVIGGPVTKDGSGSIGSTWLRWQPIS